MCTGWSQIRPDLPAAVVLAFTSTLLLPTVISPGEAYVILGLRTASAASPGPASPLPLKSRCSLSNNFFTNGSFTISAKGAGSLIGVVSDLTFIGSYAGSLNFCINSLTSLAGPSLGIVLSK